jgi:ribosome-dependent ATPase
MEESMGEVARQTAGAAPVVAPAGDAGGGAFSDVPAGPRSRLTLGLGRIRAYATNETKQILRDPVRLAFAFLGSALLMLVFGFGITTDVEHIRFTALDLDRSPESRRYLEQFLGSPRYFTAGATVRSSDDALERLKADDVSVVLEIPPRFGRELRRGQRPDVLARVDGAMTFRGDTIEQYVRGVHESLLRDPSLGLAARSREAATADIAERFMYNPTFESVYSIVPSVPALLLLLIPAILMAVSIVREKELGSMINFYVTPTGRLEYLLGKQLPYIAIGLLNFLVLTAMALVVFGVPIKGSFLMLFLCTTLYVAATTGIGMVTSTITSSQVAAVFVTAILTIVPTIQFSGMLQPVSTLEGGAGVVGSIWPASYYMHASLGAYTKGLGARLMLTDFLYLLGCVPLLLLLSVLGLRKQER